DLTGAADPVEGGGGSRNLARAHVAVRAGGNERVLHAGRGLEQAVGAEDGRVEVGVGGVETGQLQVGTADDGRPVIAERDGVGRDNDGRVAGAGGVDEGLRQGVIGIDLGNAIESVD